MKLNLKLPLAFGFTLALLLIAALFGIRQLDRSLTAYDTVVQTHVAHERAAAALENSFKTQVQEWKNTLLRGKDPQQLERYWVAFQKEERSVADGAARLREALPDGESRTLVEKFAQAHARMGEGYRQGYAAFTAAGFDPAAGDNGVKGMDREPVKLLGEAAQRIAAESAQIAAQASAEGRRAIRLSLVVMFGVTLLGIVVGIGVSRTIVRPLGQAVQVAQAVASGDLTVAVQARSRDETGLLLLALAEMQQRLTALVRGVRANAEGVATASAEIAHGNNDLSLRTERQAAALEETAASMDELGAAVRQNADNAVQANQLANGASSVAMKGGEVVSNVVQTMRGIHDSSNQIAAIIDTIDGIAFQTNILALNAAVEAARAGEQGRGFAVVAGEVRALAQRSAAAAKEISALIGASVDRVAQGSALVDQAGTTMNEVVDAIRRVTALMAEINTATGEQSTGVAQVGSAIAQMDQATQQNAALVEQSAAAAESLKLQAQRLVEAVAVFRLPGVV
ncbi:methyl-accepting chemotaxis protein [Rhizobacter sp. SG703]|uniref:methyl-accepting chemotaxis protein n=1 Tax=Rhizobacter sp. SG703 TaxID=2587140 RepID=UPI001447375B|nr:methyl-accepting chemotaxis protein [Rhizobacter sp. SG703]NKI93457.1 methyl-accepting chemotaxis protein-1 (serine sensor receptor) [Rhizobacter sp. SG703]